MEQVINKPLVSIVTVCFNSEKMIRQTIESVLNQTYTNIEYILVDGKSTDSTVAIIEEYAPLFAERGIQYQWVSEPDTGMYNAINKGFLLSSGEIMCWINSDDFFLFDYSIKQVVAAFVLYPEADWISFFPVAYSESGETFGLPSIFAPFSQYLIKRGYYHDRGLGFIQQESTFWRRKVYRLSGGYVDESYKYAGDFDLWRRFAEHVPLYKINNCVSGFRKHELQKTSNIENYYAEISKFINWKSKLVFWFKHFIKVFLLLTNKRFNLNSINITKIK